MRTRKQKFAERHNTMAATYLQIAKEYLSLGSGFQTYFDYYFGMAKDHQAMCHYFGY